MEWFVAKQPVISPLAPLDRTLTDMQKTFFFTQTWFEPKIFYPKKLVNYGKSNSRQNSVKGKKEPNSVKKNAKKYHIVPKCAKKSHQKEQNCAITYFPDKTA